MPKISSATDYLRSYRNAATLSLLWTTFPWRESSSTSTAVLLQHVVCKTFSSSSRLMCPTRSRRTLLEIKPEPILLALSVPQIWQVQDVLHPPWDLFQLFIQKWDSVCDDSAASRNISASGCDPTTEDVA